MFFFWEPTSAVVKERTPRCAHGPGFSQSQNHMKVQGPGSQHENSPDHPPRVGAPEGSGMAVLRRPVPPRPGPTTISRVSGGGLGRFLELRRENDRKSSERSDRAALTRVMALSSRRRAPSTPSSPALYAHDSSKSSAPRKRSSRSRCSASPHKPALPGRTNPHISQ